MEWKQEVRTCFQICSKKINCSSKDLTLTFILVHKRENTLRMGNAGAITTAGEVTVIPTDGLCVNLAGKLFSELRQQH